MAQIRSFRSLHYNTSRFSDLSRYISNTDLLSLEQTVHLPKRRLYHIEKILAGINGQAEGDRYKVARKLLDDFKDKKVLVRDQLPFIYVYQVYYRHKISGLDFVRRGFIALGKLENYPAIQDLAPPPPPQKRMFLNLLQNTMTLFSPIVMLYQDKKDRINALLDEACAYQEPALEVSYPNHEIHRVYRITHPTYLKKLQQLIQNKPIFQMNGDPGYSALQEFKQEMDHKLQLNWGMMVFFNLLDSVPFLTPTRLVKQILERERFYQELHKWFDIKDYPFETPEDFQRQKIEFFEDLRIEGYGHKHFGLYVQGQKCFQLLSMKEERVFAQLSFLEVPEPLKKTDPAILDQFLLKKLLKHKLVEFERKRDPLKSLRYLSDLEDSLQKVNQGEYEAVFFLNAIPIPDIQELLEKKQAFPQGSLDLSISPLAGLLMQPLEDEGEVLED